MHTSEPAGFLVAEIPRGVSHDGLFVVSALVRIVRKHLDGVAGAGDTRDRVAAREVSSGAAIPSLAMPSSVMPSQPFPKMLLRATLLWTVPVSIIHTPAATLPAMMLAAAGSWPPTKLSLLPPSRWTPALPLGRNVVPLASTPIRFPWIRFRWDPMM